ncbi:MAG: LysR family transcriptional regulator [Hydrogenophaga sp.]|jgi:DNA-binding transcriptional LysR family regulator|uniref:LysR family transcriptional regulator n=1 Tax=Hydrogenophaga sp. TaxID=1904254 RepID=UPI00260B67D6|nr:LysR family transcriptional regulator [Hydrogenophaga sp.]MDD3786169.1 LysR family transcriptional regulator [Hydrogenophaga sp.]MDX9968774.1 LysR family transcriptional regulator [Hydrogenophaga sp.]
MKYASMFDKIDLHLIRVLHMVLTERSVSRAALKLGMYQPAVSAALKRLRELAGDPLLVRSGAGMVPTVAGLRMIEPAAEILRSAEVLFSEARSFDPATAHHTFSLAASDYMEPQFLPQLVTRIKAQAPNSRIEIHPLSADGDYRHHLAQGRYDVVIGNWPKPPDDLHLGRLFGDEVVCLVSREHPAVRRGWDVEAWLAAEHVAPMPTHPGARGVIDDHLASQGLARNIAVRCPIFGQIPAMVAGSLLVLTTGRQYCEHFVDRLPVQVLACPVPFPRLMYYQLWHERTHAAAAARWLREQIKGVAASLRRPEADVAAA